MAKSKPPVAIPKMRRWGCDSPSGCLLWAAGYRSFETEFGLYAATPKLATLAPYTAHISAGESQLTAKRHPPARGVST